MSRPEVRIVDRRPARRVLPFHEVPAGNLVEIADTGTLGWVAFDPDTEAPERVARLLTLRDGNLVEVVAGAYCRVIPATVIVGAADIADGDAK